MLIANSNLVPQWATWEEFRRLEAAGLLIYGQMTAGSWIYIGTQGILQGTYETFAAVAEKRFEGTLAGVDVDRRRRGDGRRAAAGVTLNSGAVICPDVDPSRLERRVRADATSTRSPATPTKRYGSPARHGTKAGHSVGVVGNCAEIYPRLLASGVDRRRHRSDERPRSRSPMYRPS